MKSKNKIKTLVVLKCKTKFFFLKKLTKIFSLILFLGICETSISVHVRQVTFLPEDWQKFSSEAVSSLRFN